jgi:hypothetical protein
MLFKFNNNPLPFGFAEATDDKAFEATFEEEAFDKALAEAEAFAEAFADAETSISFLYSNKSTISFSKKGTSIN